MIISKENLDLPAKGEHTTMPQSEQILQALRDQANFDPGPDDLKTAFAIQSKLEAALGGRVQDKTDYRGGHCFTFDYPFFDKENEHWLVALRVRVSRFGPYTTQMFVQSHRDRHWWTGPIRTSRVGFTPEHTAILQPLRAWHTEAGLTEVDVETQAVLVPEEIRVPRFRGRELTLFQALFT
jgi:hypothetical protein